MRKTAMKRPENFHTKRWTNFEILTNYVKQEQTDFPIPMIPEFHTPEKNYNQFQNRGRKRVKQEELDEEWTLNPQTIPTNKVPPKKRKKRSNSKNEQDLGEKKKSLYKGVCWNRKTKKWVAHSWHEGPNGKKKLHSLGSFDNELEAAKVVNYKCAELGMKLKNPGVGIQPPANAHTKEIRQLRREIAALKEELKKKDDTILSLQNQIYQSRI